MLKALRARRGEARHAARVTVAAMTAYVLYHALGLPQGYWAVFTAVIVVQTSIGATLNASLERMVGTIAGAGVGGLAAWLHPHTPAGLGAALALSVAVTAFGAANRSNLKVAPVTAVIMLISPSSGAMAGGPLEAAALRVIEIALGSLIGLLTTLFVFPARAHVVASARIRAVLGQMAGFVEGCVARLRGETLDLFAASSQIRAGLIGVESAVADAGREQSSRLGDHTLPEAIVRTLWRLRNDAVVIGRIADGPLPGPAGTQSAAAAEILLAAEAVFMRDCAAALEGSRPIDRTALIAAHEEFQTAVEALRRERLTPDLTFETVGPVFGLVYGVESLHRHLNDLADRIDEANGAAIAPGAPPPVAAGVTA